MFKKCMQSTTVALPPVTPDDGTRQPGPRVQAAGAPAGASAGIPASRFQRRFIGQLTGDTINNMFYLNSLKHRIPKGAFKNKEFKLAKAFLQRGELSLAEPAQRGPKRPSDSRIRINLSGKEVKQYQLEMVQDTIGNLLGVVELDLSGNELTALPNLRGMADLLILDLRHNLLNAFDLDNLPPKATVRLDEAVSKLVDISRLENMQMRREERGSAPALVFGNVDVSVESFSPHLAPSGAQFEQGDLHDAILSPGGASAAASDDGAMAAAHAPDPRADTAPAEASKIIDVQKEARKAVGTFVKDALDEWQTAVEQGRGHGVLPAMPSIDDLCKKLNDVRPDISPALKGDLYVKGNVSLHHDNYLKAHESELAGFNETMGALDTLGKAVANTLKRLVEELTLIPLAPDALERCIYIKIAHNHPELSRQLGVATVKSCIADGMAKHLDDSAHLEMDAHLTALLDGMIIELMLRSCDGRPVQTAKIVNDLYTDLADKRPDIVELLTRETVEAHALTKIMLRSNMISVGAAGHDGGQTATGEAQRDDAGYVDESSSGRLSISDLTTRN